MLGVVYHDIIVETYCTLYCRVNGWIVSRNEKVTQQPKTAYLSMTEGGREGGKMKGVWGGTSFSLYLKYCSLLSSNILLSVLTLLVEALHHHGTLQRSSTHFISQAEEEVSVFSIFDVFCLFLSLME